VPEFPEALGCPGSAESWDRSKDLSAARSGWSPRCGPSIRRTGAAAGHPGPPSPRVPGLEHPPVEGDQRLGKRSFQVSILIQNVVHPVVHPVVQLNQRVRLVFQFPGPRSLQGLFGQYPRGVGDRILRVPCRRGESAGEGQPRWRQSRSGSASSPARRYGGVDRILPVHHHDLPAETPLLDVRPAWVRATCRGERQPVTAFGGRARDVQSAPPPVLLAGASPGSTVLPGTTRLAPLARVTSTRRAWAFGDAGMVTCRTPSA
jgi:hypothetical protein